MWKPMGMWAWTIFLVYVLKNPNQFVTNPNLENHMYHATKSSFSYLMLVMCIWRELKFGEMYPIEEASIWEAPLGVSIRKLMERLQPCSFNSESKHGSIMSEGDPA